MTPRELPQSRSAADMQCAIGILEGRWKMMILAHLFEGPLMRFSDLQRAIPSISQKMLIQQLRALEQEKVIFRTVHAEAPPRVEYGLNEIGRALAPVFRGLVGLGGFAASGKGVGAAVEQSQIWCRAPA